MKNIVKLLVLILYTSAFAQQSVHHDTPFLQEYSVKYYFDEGITPLKVFSDRNQNTRILTDQGIYMPHNGRFLYPGTLVKDQTHRTVANKNFTGIGSLENQFVYLDETHLLSQAWAAKIYIETPFKNAKILAGNPEFNFLISDGNQLALINQDKTIFQKNEKGILDLKYNQTSDQYYILKKDGVYRLDNNELKDVYKGNNLTTFDLNVAGEIIYIGTEDGYIEYDLITKSEQLYKKLPVTAITSIKVIKDKIWFGSPMGAFSIDLNKEIKYYYGGRWIPSNEVVAIEEGPDHSVSILTDKGLAQIFYKEMTLADKAAYYDHQVRSRHIRNGLNATLAGLEKGDLSTGFLNDADNDGLWTSMYLGAETFRYAVTKSPEALQNVRESLDAMERLFTVNPVPGFTARSFERKGFNHLLGGSAKWMPSVDGEFTWKSTTSSDEAIGHMFVYGVIAELVDIPEVREKAITLMDTLMSHIIDNDMYLVDYDGKPTLWGKWNPEYVNGFPTNVGDRKLNSSNITAMLQTAYHFTGKEKYKEKAFELFEKHGYFENLMRPMSEIGKTPEDGDEYAQMLSVRWNHSDDEMYYLGYWGLYRYAFNDTLKQAYKRSILDHWELERPEKEGLWNIFTAMVGVKEFDLENAIWYLQKYPLDLITWNVQNSHRKDLVFLPENFRQQLTETVLPPDERPIRRHNANTFLHDRGGPDGGSEHSAGDIWLLPYWLARFLGVIL